MIKAEELLRKTETEFARISKVSVNSVIGLSKFEEGYLVLIETLEKAGIPDSRDILGIYEVRMDPEGNLLDFERKRLRFRGDTREE